MVIKFMRHQNTRMLTYMTTDLTAIMEFQVEAVEAEFARLKDEVPVLHEPKTMPWDNRAAQFRDPEGTLVGIYTPVSDAAKQRFGSR